MSLADPALAWLAGALDRLGAAYMVCGSVASSIHGEPRGTHDVDVVADLTTDQLDRLLAEVPPDFYVSAVAAHDALRVRSMFNIVNTATGLKIDVIIRKDRPYSVCELARRRRTMIEGTPAFVASPEDVILSKLEWSQIGESERQFRDALGVALVQGSQLDVPYLRQWATQLGLGEALERLLAAAQRESMGPPLP